MLWYREVNFWSTIVDKSSINLNIDASVRRKVIQLDVRTFFFVFRRVLAQTRPKTRSHVDSRIFRPPIAFNRYFSWIIITIRLYYGYFWNYQIKNLYSEFFPIYSSMIFNNQDFLDLVKWKKINNRDFLD